MELNISFSKQKKRKNWSGRMWKAHEKRFKDNILIMKKISFNYDENSQSKKSESLKNALLFLPSQAIIIIIVNSILHISSHETFESTKFSMFLKSKLSFSFQFYLKSTAPWHKIFLFHFIIHSLNCIRLFQLFFFNFPKGNLC